ncbi:MAG: hypothetical protein BM565_06690 [Gammaproteobacteria bacterium MedPE]|nr:MAG: hypothetical protein BM565_06690 [Gammaproteobacteria bacterium MedPE]
MKALFIFLITISSFSTHAALNESQRELAKNLTLAVKHINDAGAKMLDKETRLDSAATMLNYIIYTNTLVNYTNDQLDVNTLHGRLKENVIGNLCSNTGLSPFIESNVIMVYRYLDKNGLFVTELSKDMGTCKK